MAMHARISTLEGSPDQIDEGLRYVRENVLPQLQQQDGFKGMAALADRQTGKTLGVTFWESEQALRASEEAANSLREESAEAMSDTIAGVERYEVGFLELTGAIGGFREH
jgi:heme-degrading monooxygenase HmoA